MKTPDFFKRSELTGVLWSFRKEFFTVGAFSFVTNLLMLAPTLYMLQVYDRVLVSRNELTLLVISLLTVFLFGMMALAERLRSRVLVGAGERLDGKLGTRVFNASFETQLGQAQGDPGRAFRDLLEIRQFLTGNGIYAFFDAPWALIYIAVAFFLHPLIGVATVVFAMVQVALAWFGHRRTVAPAQAAAQSSMDVNMYLHSKLRNSEVVEAMGMLGDLRHRWQAWHAIFLARSTDSQHVIHRVQAVSKFVRYTQQSLTLAAGALLVIDGQITTGAMIAANLLVARALAPIDQIVGSWRSAISAWQSFGRLEKLLEANPERDPNLSRVAPEGHVALEGVVATAPGRAAAILKGISFRAEPGTVTVVMGPSGSGKSTLARVLLGIWPWTSGEVLIDGLPVSSWDRVDLGPHVGYLPQDIELFEGTISENIARFREVDSDRVIEAARATGLHEMILRFPKGYDTPIGEAGTLLSAGQRQRIGVARAVYGEPSLVVLDEPNSNLDDAGEAALVRTVLHLKSLGKTVFLITHRVGIISVADRVLVLHDGRLVADGPRDEVIAQLRAPAQREAQPAGTAQPA